MDSGHAQAAVLLIEAGADRERVSTSPFLSLPEKADIHHFLVQQTNQDELMPEQVDGVGGAEQRRINENERVMAA